MPPIEGFGAPGTFALRAADDAMAIRADVQGGHGLDAVIAGGGLLGLEPRTCSTGWVACLGARTRTPAWPPRSTRSGLGGSRPLPPGARIEPGRGCRGVQRSRQASASSRAPQGRPLRAVRPSRRVDRDHPDSAGASGRDRRGARDPRRRRDAHESDPFVYAAGDAAEYDGRVLGLWPTAVAQGQVAATNATGGTEIYTGSSPATSLKVSGADLTSVAGSRPNRATP